MPSPIPHYRSLLPVGRACLMALLLLLATTNWTHCATLEMKYDFASPVLRPVDIDGQMFTRVELPGAPNSGAFGSPALPSRGARILVPYGEEVVDIEVTSHGKSSLTVEYPVEPVSQLFPLSIDPSEIPPVYMDRAVYSSQSPVPASRLVSLGIQSFRGYQIVILKLNPVDYVPATGVLEYYSEIHVEVTTALSGGPPPSIRNHASDRAEISGWIDNPTALSSYLAAAGRGAVDYDMLLITFPGLETAFQPLKDYHDSTGVLTEIRTLSDMGCTDPHCIRDYIRQEFSEHGIQYVLIGGDDDLIPALDMYCRTWEGPGALEEYQMPGDMYYSCLDGTFNYDGDDRWAEPTDGEGGGEIDLFPDVNVGRVSAGSAAEIANYTNKLVAYLESNDPYLERVLLAGEQLGFGDLGEYGGYAMDEMVDASDAHGFLTYAFPSWEYDISKLYDLTRAPNNYWPGSELISWLNSGVHVVDHLGHSGPGYAMRTDTTMLRNNLHNTQYCFLYAEGCSAGHFDQTDCWAEYVTVKLPAGGFGCIANSRVGIGSRSTRHPVHVFNREFWDAIYDANEAKPEMGRAIADCRVDHIYHINDPAMRWNFYEINLFGDPSLAIKPVCGLTITCPNGLPSTVPPLVETTVDVKVNGIGEGVPVPGTGQLHYWYGSGDTSTIPMTEQAPGEYEATLPPLGCETSLNYCFSAEESATGRVMHPNAGTAFSVVAVSEEIVLFEDDFEADRGWTVSGGLWERGVPLGMGGEELQYPVPDPTEGCNGPQVFGYNLSGDYENDLPARHLTSPAIDCSTAENVHLRFCRWLGVERPIYDKAGVSVSTNGSTWITIWENPATLGDLVWREMEYDISTLADGQPQVYIRFTMGPTDGGLVYNGWNIDDVRVVAFECVDCECAYQNDFDADNFITALDLSAMIDILYSSGIDPQDQYCPMQRGDSDCDGFTTALDLARIIDHLFSGQPGPCDPCSP